MTRRLSSLSIGLLVLAGAGAGPALAGGSADITGGHTETGYPAVFSLGINGEGGCTGTCITPRIALTAKHCIDGMPATVFSGLFGNTETAPTQTIPVTAVASHATADIAIVAFAQDCPAFIPYNRESLDTHLGDAVVMVGYGVTTETGSDYGIKRSGTATLSSLSPQQTLGLEQGELATSNRPSGTCYGDSGGPTFMTFGGEERIIGTTSRGSMKTATQEYPCGMGESIAVRTDSYEQFIDDFIAAHDPGSLPDGEGGDGGDGGDPGDGGGGDTSPGDGTGGDDSTASGGCSTGGVPGWLVLGALAGLRRRRR